MTGPLATALLLAALAAALARPAGAARHHRAAPTPASGWTQITLPDGALD